MKNKKILSTISIIAIVAFGGVTVFGANEFRINNNLKLTNTSDFQNRFQFENSYSSFETAKINGNVQEITTILEPSAFPVIVVQKDIPLKWTMIADKTNLNYCNNEIFITALNLKETIDAGENIIQFTPTENGVIPYSCWMGMVSSSIVVVDDINNYDIAEIQTQLARILRTDCCSGRRR